MPVMWKFSTPAQRLHAVVGVLRNLLLAQEILLDAVGHGVLRGVSSIATRASLERRRAGARPSTNHCSPRNTARIDLPQVRMRAVDSMISRLRRVRRYLSPCAHHLAADECDLRLQRQLLRAHVVAGEQRHAPEHAAVVADELVVVLVGALVARIEAEARDLVQAHRADEVLAHARGAATGHAAAALDAAVEQVDFLGEIGLHALLDPRQVDLGLLQVHPRLEPLAHRAHPVAGIDRQVADQLEHRQRRQRDVRPDVLGEGSTGKVGATVDHHPAAAADARAADKVELQRRVELLPDLVQRDEERHALRLLELEGLHVRHAGRVGRVVAHDAQLDLLTGHRLALGCAHRIPAWMGCVTSGPHSPSRTNTDSGASSAGEGWAGGKRSSILSFLPRSGSGSRCWYGIRACCSS